MRVYMHYFLGKARTQGQSQTQRREDLLLAEVDELKKMHGNNLPPYKYRLWAEMIVRLTER